jgi:hypothetical protein
LALWNDVGFTRSQIIYLQLLYLPTGTIPTIHSTILLPWSSIFHKKMRLRGWNAPEGMEAKGRRRRRIPRATKARVSGERVTTPPPGGSGRRRRRRRRQRRRRRKVRSGKTRSSFFSYYAFVTLRGGRITGRWNGWTASRFWRAA